MVVVNMINLKESISLLIQGLIDRHAINYIIFLAQSYRDIMTKEEIL
jgi:hypothetical protein